MLSPTHAVVRQRKDDLSCAFDYSFAGEDVTISVDASKSLAGPPRVLVTQVGVTPVLVTMKGTGTHYEGTYSGFLEKIGWDEENEDGADDSKKEITYNKKDIRKLRSDIITKRSKEIKPLEDKIIKTEKRSRF